MAHEHRISSAKLDVSIKSPAVQSSLVQLGVGKVSQSILVSQATALVTIGSLHRIHVSHASASIITSLFPIVDIGEYAPIAAFST